MEQVEEEGVNENLLQRKLELRRVGCGVKRQMGQINATLRGEESDEARVFNEIEEPKGIDAS